MKLSIVISVHNQLNLAKSCYENSLWRHPDFNQVERIIIDNESTPPLRREDFPFAKIVRNEKNIGVYPTFKQGFEVSTGDVVAFLHSDVVVWEPDWEMRVLNTFNLNPQIGLVGFVGSDEIDQLGGRGGGTMSNFQGKMLVNTSLGTTPDNWHGSPAEAHGKRMLGYQRGAVVDGCVMAIRRDAWNKIGYRENFPPHHFYDRLISTQMLEVGYHVGVFGVAFDHISGQTVNQEKGYHTMAFEWLSDNLVITPPFDPTKNYDTDIYTIAEKKWLNEYRDTKHIVPTKI